MVPSGLQRPGRRRAFSLVMVTSLPVRTRKARVEVGAWTPMLAVYVYAVASSSEAESEAESNWTSVAAVSALAVFAAAVGRPRACLAGRPREPRELRCGGALESDQPAGLARHSAVECVAVS